MAAWLIVVGLAAVLGFSGFLYLVLDPAFTTVFDQALALSSNQTAENSISIVQFIYQQLPIIFIVFIFVAVIIKVVNESERGI